jgi:hypothetical protein
VTNANFPNIEYGWGASWASNGGDVPLDKYVNVTGRTTGSMGTQRGRQYELDQVQSGTMSSILQNNDGSLDPTNVSGPYYGHIWPYQPCKVRAQWPPTANLFTPAIASCAGLAAGLADQGPTGPAMFGAGLSVVASGSAFAGTSVWSVPVTNGEAADSSVMFTYQAAVTAGKTYSFTARVRNTTNSTTQAVYPFLSFHGADGTVVSVTHGTSVALVGSSVGTTWSTITVTATAPANAAQLAIGIGLTSAATAALTIQSNAWQYQEGAATAYGDPGAWYPLYSGYVERWPQSWTQGGTYSLVQPTAVDAFALLSQRTLRDPLTEEISARSPRFLFKLDDPQFSQNVTDATGNYSPPPTAVAKQGAGSLTFGNQITATDTVNGVFAGDGTVATFSNASPGTLNYDKATYIPLVASGIRGPAGNWNSDFTRVIAFRYTGPVPSGAGAFATIWGAGASTKSAGTGFGFVIGTDQKPYIMMSGPDPTISYVTYNPPGGAVCDGNWHFIYMKWTAATSGLSIGLDGNNGGTVTVPAYLIPNSQLGSDSLGAWIDPVGSSWNYKGDLAYAAEFPSALSNGDLNTLYSAWRNAFAGDATDIRYSRILGYAGYLGPRALDTGQTQSMGPLVSDGQDALSALQEVVDTESGQHFVSADGTVTFKARSARYNAGTPVYTFGEHEFPYEDIALDYDPTHLGNLVEVTQAATSQIFSAEDAASQTAYFPRSIQRTINATSSLECQDAANYLLSRYKNPLTRIDSLVLNPSANPALWPVCLSLELGMRIRVIRRPFGRPAITVDAFVESVAWNLDPDSGEARVTLQCSPIDATPYGSLGAWHTTTSQAYPIGTSGIAVAPHGDNQNSITAQISPGTNVVIEPGTANAETLTIDHMAATAPGWTFAVLVMTSSTTKAHPAGAVICEALPSGVTDPAKWDGVCQFDSHAYVY